MRKIFSLITALVLCTAMWGQTTSAFYNLPDGAFVQGMSTTGTITGGEIYLPYKVGSHKFSSTTGAGDWWSNGNKQTTGKESYSYSNLSVNSKKTIPQLRQSGKISYQYGATDSTKYNTGLYFYVSDSNMHYMTSAKLRADLVSKGSGEAHALTKYYKAGGDYDTIGLYFNNTAEMYIDGISIPIKNSSATKLSNMFLNENARVIATFYKATAVGKKSNNALDRNTIYLRDTLTSDNYNQSSSVNTGALNKTFKTPISIDGPFVVELTGYNDCRFNFYSALEKYGCNYWGYYINNGIAKYLNTDGGSYCLAVSVHAMFPVLEKQDAEKTLEFTSEGGDDNVVVLSNIDPNSKDFAIDFGEAEWISKKDIAYDKTSGKGTLTFTAEANTGEAREATITLKHHLKEVTYTVSQEAAPATKYYAKNNWNGATEWSWLEMSATDQENIYMLDSVVFGGTGVNINDKEDDTDALSFDTDKIVVLDDLDGLPGPIPPEPRKRDTIPYAPRHSGVVLEAPQLLAGDTIKLFFNAADSTLKAFIIGRPAPVIEYKYTTYTEWQVKQDETSSWGDMTKQEDGTFTVASLWYNLGLYIASGENPIKQDWYPLDDAALTIAGDVAELDNVVITLTVKDDETVALNVKKQTATSIDNVKAAQGQRYNILGQPVKETYRGIVIMNGQTFIQ